MPKGKMMPGLRRLIALCLTDGVGAIHFAQRIPDKVAEAHSLVRAVAAYNIDLSDELPNDPIILTEIVDEISDSVKRMTMQ